MTNQMTINVNPNDLPEIKCPCGCNVFAAGVMIRKVSALINPAGTPGVAATQVFYCVKCSRPIDAAGNGIGDAEQTT